MTAFQPLPVPPPPATDQTVLQRGLSILAFVMAHGVTATIDDVDLERADHAGSFASAGRDFAPATYDRISDARNLIRRAITTRAADGPQGATLPGGTAPHKPDLGPMAPLQDRPITRPPSGDYVDVDDYARIDRVQF